MENLKVGEIYHITDKKYPCKKMIYKHDGMSDSQRGYGFYLSNLNGNEFEFKKSTPSLKDRDIKKATELESEWLKYCIKDNTYVSYHDFMMDYKHKLTGRKVRALIDNPYSGTVPKGEIGVIISTSGYIYVDFPSQQGYLLNGDIDESKIELLPPDFTHLYEVGKWYKFKGENKYAKFKNLSSCNRFFYFTECIIEGRYRKINGCFYTKECEDAALDSDIQKFITPSKKIKKFPIGPIGIKDIRENMIVSNFDSNIENVKHGNCRLADSPDIRIIGYEDDLYVVRWTDYDGREVIQGFKEKDLVEAKNPEKLVFGKFNIGDIVVSMTDITGYRDKGDLFVVLPNSSKNTLWYRTHVNNEEINSTKSDGWRLATDDEKKLYENGFTNINYKCCVKITKENAYQLNLFLELNKDKYCGYHPYWGVSEDSIGKFFHFPSYNGSVGYIHTSLSKYYPEVTLEELYEKAGYEPFGYKPFEKKPVEIKAVLEEMAFRIKDHKKEQKDNRLIQLKIRDKSVTTTTQQRVKLKIIKPSLITIKN